ncbi:MAG: hypothetical protein GDA36_06135 [Rhodobacteraceae bacterium]|nr:hypothetical protein [Paracoccaceae bacterium]
MGYSVRSAGPYIGQGGFWWSGYAIVGVCGLRVILFVTPRRFCSIATIANRACVLVSPNYRVVLHRGIGIAQSLKRRLRISMPPHFPGHAGVDDGRAVHDPVTAVVARGIPVWPCWHRPCRSYPPARSPL